MIIVLLATNIHTEFFLFSQVRDGSVCVCVWVCVCVCVFTFLWLLSSYIYTDVYPSDRQSIPECRRHICNPRRCSRTYLRKGHPDTRHSQHKVLR